MQLNVLIVLKLHCVLEHCCKCSYFIKNLILTAVFMVNAHALDCCAATAPSCVVIHNSYPTSIYVSDDEAPSLQARPAAVEEP